MLKFICLQIGSRLCLGNVNVPNISIKAFYRNGKNKKVTIGENFCFSFKSGNIGTKKNARQYYDSHKNAIDGGFRRAGCQFY